MIRLKHIPLFLLLITFNTTFGQQNILKYSISLFADTTIIDTIRTNVSYISDMGKKEGYLKLQRIATRYSIQVFWKGPVDSAGFLTEKCLLDTSYTTPIEKLIRNLKRDSKNSRPNRLLNLTQWTWVFIVPNREVMTSHDKRGVYLYHRLRYDSFLVL